MKEREGKNKRNQMVDTLMKNEYVMHNYPLGRNRNTVALEDSVPSLVFSYFALFQLLATLLQCRLQDFYNAAVSYLSWNTETHN